MTGCFVINISMLQFCHQMLNSYRRFV